eukprot:1255906-Pyramimonas_sp.AAC.1
MICAESRAFTPWSVIGRSPPGGRGVRRDGLLGCVAGAAPFDSLGVLRVGPLMGGFAGTRGEFTGTRGSLVK